MTSIAPTKTAARGFAALDTATKERISRLGGQAAQAKGTAHKWTPDEAVAAGRRGGLATAAARRQRKAEA